MSDTSSNSRGGTASVPPRSRPPRRGREVRPAQAGFSLVELQVAMAIILIVLTAVIASYLYALRMYEFVRPKLSAADDARAAVARLTDEIRSAYLLRIGSGTLTTFTEAAPNSLQQGSALQIYPSTNTNSFVRYYWDASDRTLKRASNSATEALTIAHSVSNSVIFTAEDYTGSVLTNNFNNRVIGLTLQFFQIQYPATAVGPGQFYDFYQLRTKITRRSLL